MSAHADEDTDVQPGFWSKKAPWLLILAPLVLAAPLYLLSFLVVISGLWHEVSRALGEGFFVAFVLAVTGDLYLRSWRYKESLELGVRRTIGEMFGFLSRGRPEELTQAVYRFANAPIVSTRVIWNLRFDWEDKDAGILRVRLSYTQFARNISKVGYLPVDDTFIVESSAHYSSKYIEYTLECSQSDIRVAKDATTLAPHCRPEPGRVVLSQRQLLNHALPDGKRIGKGHDFFLTKKGVMYRRSRGYVPLVHRAFTLTFVLELEGDALGDLDLTAFQPESEGVGQVWRVRGCDVDGTPEVHQWESVSPGQATVIGWARLDGVGDEPVTEAPGPQ